MPLIRKPYPIKEILKKKSLKKVSIKKTSVKALKPLPAITFIARTDGRSAYTKGKKKTKLTVTIYKKDYIIRTQSIYTPGNLKVTFSPNDWDVYTDGLIYLDNCFLDDVRKALKKYFINGNDIDYSEQGRQGITFVDFDIGNKLAKEIKLKYKL
jgi:hypothetical protein